MKITECWLKLKVDKYEDGNYEAYEALADSRKESTNWEDIADWLHNLIDETTKEISTR